MMPDENQTVSELEALFNTAAIEEWFAFDEGRVSTLGARMAIVAEFVGSPAFERMVKRFAQRARREEAIYAAVMAGVRFGYWLAQRRKDAN